MIACNSQHFYGFCSSGRAAHVRIYFEPGAMRNPERASH